MSRCVRVLALSLSVLVVASLITLAPSPASAVLVNPNSATTGIICRGFSGCTSAGMSSSGYSSVYRSMFWRMYSGHNCTNYVAYRMVHSGMPNVRPWSGSGNATNWGYANSRVTGSVPSEGAVAWWRAYARPAGSAGHVAYVERVVSRDEIIVSQDSWGGDFSWARITRYGGSWPTGFVHFRDIAALSNTGRPQVSGVPKVGSRLTATGGSWTASSPSLHYQWQAAGIDIPGAISTSLVLTPAQVGKRIRMRVTATGSGVSVGASSLRTSAVQPATITPSARPSIAGDVTVASTLTAVPGTWSPRDTVLSYHWFANGYKLIGRTEPTLTLRPRLVGKPISLSVTGRKDGYDDVKSSSVPTAPVAPGTLAMSAPPTVTGPARTGQTLTLQRGAIDPVDAQTSVQWLRAGKPVAGATSTTYRTTKADLGSPLVAQLRSTRRGYLPLVTTTAPTRRVRATSSLSVVATRRPGARTVDVTARVTTPDVSPVTGTLGIRLDGKLVRTVDLRRGSAAAALTAVSPGQHTIRVWFRRTPLVTSTYQVRKVTVS